MALNLAPFGRWTALKRRRLALRYVRRNQRCSLLPKFVCTENMVGTLMD